MLLAVYQDMKIPYKTSIFSVYQNEQDGKEIRKNSIHNNLKKYLGINLPKEEKDLYNENLKS
jgi:hypothetical protein